MSTVSLSELISQREALDRQIAETQQAQRAETIAKIKAMMLESGVSLADLADGESVRASKYLRARPKSPNGVVPVKYRNASTGETWTGRGMQPKWLRAAIEAGAKTEDFLVNR